MRIQIIGYGVVGKAQAHLAEMFGHKLNIYDPFVFPCSTLKEDADITFICTPESEVENAVKHLLFANVHGLYVIKSTVPLFTTEKLMKKYDVHICHNPEFLREKTAFVDVLNPDRIVIGKCCDVHADLLKLFYLPLGTPIYVTDPSSSELVKLASNAYLSMLITFWNEIALLASKTNLNVKEIAEIVCSDRRMSRYGTEKFLEPFGGKCLPKDLKHLINTFHSVGLNPTLFEAMRSFNQKLKEEVKKKDG